MFQRRRFGSSAHFRSAFDAPRIIEKILVGEQGDQLAQRPGYAGAERADEHRQQGDGDDSGGGGEIAQGFRLAHAARLPRRIAAVRALARSGPLVSSSSWWARESRRNSASPPRVSRISTSR